MRILLIEDSRAVYDLLVREIRRCSFEVELVWMDTLAAARSEMIRNGYDAVLLDIGIPDAERGNSINNLAEIIKLTGHPVVILSGNEDPKEITRAINAGAAAYLTKRLIPECVLQVFITLYVAYLKNIV